MIINKKNTFVDKSAVVINVGVINQIKKKKKRKINLKDSQKFDDKNQIKCVETIKREGGREC